MAGAAQDHEADRAQRLRRQAEREAAEGAWWGVDVTIVGIDIMLVCGAVDSCFAGLCVVCQAQGSFSVLCLGLGWTRLCCFPRRTGILALHSCAQQHPATSPALRDPCRGGARRAAPLGHRRLFADRHQGCVWSQPGRRLAGGRRGAAGCLQRPARRRRRLPPPRLRVLLPCMCCMQCCLRVRCCGWDGSVAACRCCPALKCGSVCVPCTCLCKACVQGALSCCGWWYRGWQHWQMARRVGLQGPVAACSGGAVAEHAQQRRPKPAL